MKDLLNQVRKLKEIWNHYAYFYNVQPAVIINHQDMKSINRLINVIILDVEPYSEHIAKNLVDIANHLYMVSNVYTFNPFNFGALGYLLNYLESDEFICNYSRYITTPWTDINDALANLLKEASMAKVRLDYNKVGVVARELFIMLAKKVYIKDIHESVGGKKISSSDAKGMLLAYLNYELDDDKLKEYAVASVQLAEPVTHTKTENRERMNTAVIAVANMIALINNIYQNNNKN